MNKLLRLCTIALCMGIGIVHAQNVANTFNLPDENNYETGHFMAKDHITLSNGFSWSAQDGEFRAEINNKLIQPDLTNTTGGPGGEVGNTGVVGASSGSYSVNSGSFSYSMPIMVSPGVRGMQPSLSINYVGGSTTGLLSDKFSLSGLSAIVRGGKNLFDDGEYDHIKWDDADNLYYNGTQLIEYSSNKPTSIEYRLKTSNRTKIIAYNIDTDGPEYFEVIDEFGTIMQYGKTSDSRQLAYVDASNPTFAWFLNKITDIDGNTIQYNYTCDYTASGSIKTDLANYRPTSIVYGNGTNLKGYVNFEYESNPVSVSYAAGNAFKLNKRIKIISTGYNSKQLRRYHLEYTTIGDKALLSKVTEFGTDDVMHYNATVFDYNDSSEHPTSYGDFNPLSEKCVTGDFNGDGKEDLVGDKGVLLSSSSGHTTLTSFTFQSSNITGVKDINSDGNEDIIYNEVVVEPGEPLPGGGTSDPTNKTVFTYYESYGNGFTQRFKLELEGEYDRTILADLNNDKKTELLVYRNSDKKLVIYEINCQTNNFIEKDYLILSGILSEIKTGSMFGDGNQHLFVVMGTQIDIIAYNQSNQLEKLYTLNTDHTGSCYFEDFNGDGITDLFRLYENELMSFYIGTGNSYIKDEDFLTNLHISDFPNGNNILTSDFDGDGIHDIIVYKAFHNVPGSQDPNNMVTDFSFSLLKGGEKFVKEALPGYEQTYSEEDIFENHPVAGDFDGDGAAEILNVFYKTISSYQKENKTRMVEISSRDKNFALSSVSNVNGTISIEYQNLTDGGNFYQSGSQVTFPLLKVNFPIWLVSSVEEEITNNEVNTTKYTYIGLTEHLLGAGILGFQQTEAYNENTGMIGRTQFEINSSHMFMYPHISEYVHIEGSTEETLSRSTNILSEVDLGSGRYHSYVSNVESKNLKSNTKSIKETEQDGNGNTILSTTRVYDGTTLVYTKTEDPEYEINTTTEWIPGRIETYVVTESRPNETAITRNQSFSYYSNGKLETVIQEPGDTKEVSQTIQYDTFGNVSSKTLSADNDPLISQDLKSVTETYLYTADGRFMEKAINPLNQFVINKYDEVSGALVEQTDINGLKAYSQYDALNRTSLAIGADGTTSYSTLKWIDSGDTDAPEAAFYMSESKSSLNNVGKTYYDKVGRTIRTVGQKQNENRSDKVKVYVDFEYDQTTGLLYRQSMPHYLNQSNILYTTYTYDKYNRAKTVTKPDGSVLTYTYNESLRSVTSSVTKGTTTVTTTQKNNALGELIESTNNDGSKVAYKYYSNGLLKQSGIAGNNADVVMTYDIYGNKLSTQTPNGGTSTNMYNAWGQVVSTTDARNLKVEFAYDILGRIIEKQVQSGATTSFTYDTKWKGALSGLSSSNNFSIDYTYDKIGRQINYTETIEGKSFSTAMQYDEKGRLSQYIYPSGFELNYHYLSESDYLTGISYGDDQFIWEAGEQNQYMAFENYTLGTLNPVELQYDEYGRFKRKYLTGYYDYNVAYDDKGNINQRREDIYNNSESFVYDNLNRLQSISTYHNAIKVGERTFNYDSYSNITEPAKNTLLYDNTKHNRLQSIEQDGLDLAYGGLSFDTENNLTAISKGNEVIDFTYGFDKARRKAVQKQNQQIVKTKYYQSNYEEVTENNNTQRIHYISAPSGLSAINVMDENDVNHMYFTLSDHLGSINMLIDESGNIVEEQAFDAWGVRRDPQNWGNAATVSTYITDRGFTMHEHLDDFNLIHMNGRVYCPNTMQFVSPDPFIQAPGNTANYNRYSYCMNNPINCVDPSGYINQPPLPRPEGQAGGSGNRISSDFGIGAAMLSASQRLNNYTGYTSGGFSGGSSKPLNTGLKGEWEYNRHIGMYENIYTGQKVSEASMARSGILESFSSTAKNSSLDNYINSLEKIGAEGGFSVT